MLTAIVLALLGQCEIPPGCTGSCHNLSVWISWEGNWRTHDWEVTARAATNYQAPASLNCCDTTWAYVAYVFGGSLDIDDWLGWDYTVIEDHLYLEHNGDVMDWEWTFRPKLSDVLIYDFPDGDQPYGEAGWYFAVMERAWFVAHCPPRYGGSYTRLFWVYLPFGCPGDFDNNSRIDINDLLVLLAHWGDPYDVADFMWLLEHWGSCPFT